MKVNDFPADREAHTQPGRLPAHLLHELENVVAILVEPVTVVLHFYLHEVNVSILIRTRGECNVLHRASAHPDAQAARRITELHRVLEELDEKLQKLAAPARQGREGIATHLPIVEIQLHVDGARGRFDQRLQAGLGFS